MALVNLEQYRIRMLIIPIGSAILLFSLAYLYYKNEKRVLENESYLNLETISKLKAAQVSSWYEERYRDAAYFSSSTILLDQIEAPAESGRLNRGSVKRLFNTLITGKIYEDILVVDINGNILFSFFDNYQLDTIIRGGITDIIKTNRINAYKIYYCHQHQTIHSDVMAPLITNDSIIKGILIMRIDPYEFLYPYIQTWPVASLSAETILSTRKGDSVVLLNEVRKISNLAMKYKLPLTDTLVPSVAAVLGKKGRFYGTDYFGDIVLSDIGRIEGSPWYIVVKIDRSEVNSELRYKTAMFLGMSILTIILITGGHISGYKRRQETYMRQKDKEYHQKFATELKRQVDQRTSELVRSNEELLEFSHIISHDLKEPIRKMKLFTSLFKLDYEHKFDMGALGYLRKIELSADRLYSMVDGILKYTEVHDTNLQISKIDLNEIMQLIRSDLELLIESKKAILRIEELPVIEGINLLVYKLFYNLLNNSLKFTKPDVQPIIEVSSKIVKLSGKEFAEITVKDNGIGFEQEYSVRIFKSFTRLNPKDLYEGTGLGLALCKKIADRHNGYISATGGLNQGATFIVLLPVRQD